MGCSVLLLSFIPTASTAAAADENDRRTAQVEGSEERNIILNWWFAMHPEKKQQAFAEQVRAGGYA